MPDDFDPYYTWLAIPPDDQPPDHYRLLGLRAFEGNPDAISNAATQRIAHLRLQQAGSHGQLAKQILNAVAAARVCLLDPHRKQLYDDHLRQAMSLHATEVAKSRETGGQSMSLGKILLQVEDDYLQHARHESPVASEPTPRQKLALYIGSGLFAAGLVIVGILWATLGRQTPAKTQATLVFDWQGDERQAEVYINGKAFELPASGPLLCRCQPGKQRIRALRPGFQPYEELVEVKAGQKLEVRPTWLPEEKQVAQVKPPTTPQPGLEKELRVTPESPQPEPTPPPAKPVDPASEKPAATPEPAPSNPPPTPKPEEPKPEEPKPEPTPAPKPAPEPAPQPSPTPAEKKLKPAVPPASAQEEVVKQLNDAYDFNAARSAGEKLRLARTLLELSDKAQDNPAELFVLSRKTMDLANDGGDASLMLKAIDSIEAHFAVDGLEVKRKMVTKFAAGTPDAARIESLSGATAALVAEAQAADRLDVALDVAKTLYQVCSKSNDQAARKFAFDQRAEVQRLADQWKQVQEALAKLQDTPADPAANHSVGCWYCAKKANWEQGLPYLAKCGDARLQGVAQQELTAPPSEPMEQVKLADGWWDAAQQTNDAPLKKALLARAGAWYEKARPGLTSPVLQQKVDNRLKQVEQSRTGK